MMDRETAWFASVAMWDKAMVVCDWRAAHAGLISNLASMCPITPAATPDKSPGATNPANRHWSITRIMGVVHQPLARAVDHQARGVDHHVHRTARLGLRQRCGEPQPRAVPGERRMVGHANVYTEQDHE